MQFVDLPDKFSDGPLIKPETSPQAYETATPACPSLLTARPSYSFVVQESSC